MKANYVGVMFVRNGEKGARRGKSAAKQKQLLAKIGAGKLGK